MADRKFIVTIRDEVQDELDADDIQEAVVSAAQHVYDHIDHGNVDVELVEADRVAHMSNAKVTTIRYRVLDVA